MKVQFIKHSGFTVTMDSVVMVFDYYKGELPDFDPEVPVYVFVSHAHDDHFNPEIVDKMQNHPKVTFIMSSDIPVQERTKMAAKAAGGEFIYMAADMQEIFPELKVRTLKSTDEGVAFIIEAEKKKIYYAGDLHWWTWPGECDEAEENMKQAFMHEMDKIKDEAFDLAFLVLDPRQEERYWWGFDYFMKNTRTRYAFPMHSWGKYELAEHFVKEKFTESYREAIIPVHKMGEIFLMGIDSKPGMV